MRLMTVAALLWVFLVLAKINAAMRPMTVAALLWVFSVLALWVW